MKTPTLLLTPIVLTSILLGANVAQAQTYNPTNRFPVADKTAIGTQVSGSNNNFTITGGLSRGQNLFHSFTDFSVPTGGSATFNHTVGEQSIITRVTGNLFSDINGLVNTQGANFLLINPIGMVFGPNAQLNVGKAFVGSTANGIDLVDGSGRTVTFGTNPNGDAPLLSIDPNVFFNVSRLNMGGGSGAISNFGKLETTNPNQYIGLIGGNVSMNGGEINAPGGRVEIGGLSTFGTVSLGVDVNNIRAQFPANVGRGNVSLTNGSRVSVAGAGGGDITISARNLEILGGSVVRGGIEEGLGTPQAVAGDIKLNATGDIVVGSNSLIFNDVRLNSKGQGGNVTIDTGSLSLQNDAQLSASTEGTGNAGNVKVTAKNAVSLVTGDIFSRVEAGGVGNGGTIDINAASLSLREGAQITTSTIGKSDTQPAGKGDAGNITVTVTGAVDIAGIKGTLPSGIRSTIGTGAVGKGGTITIDAGSFSLQDGAALSASTAGTGNAGSVIVKAKEAVSLVNANIFSQVRAGGVGEGGTIDINAASLSLREGAQITTSTIGKSDTQPAGKGDAGNITVTVTGAVDIAGIKGTFPSGIRSTIGTGAIGKGGTITIDAGSFSLQDGAALSASTAGTGNAGSVIVKAKEAVSLVNADIFSQVRAGGVGEGGTIDINAASLSLREGAQITTSTIGKSDTQPAGKGDAGNITVTVTGAVDIAGIKGTFPSGIRSTIGTGAVGKGGTITIDAGSFSLQDGAELSASTLGTGKAGNVIVKAKETVSLVNADIFSQVKAGGVGEGGTIDINAASLSLLDGSQLQTGIFGKSDTQPAGQGNAGNITVKVSGAVDIAGIKDGFTSAIFSDIETGVKGNGGNITVEAGSFSLRDGARLVASTAGTGTAGNVTVTAKEVVSLIGRAAIFSTVKAGGVGKGGMIDINAASFSLQDGSQLQTGIFGKSDTQPAGQGNAGNITIKVSGAVNIAGKKDGFTSAIFSDIETGVKGNGGNITVEAGSFSLRDGSQLVASTFGQGTAGTIKVNATDFVTISGKNDDNIASGLLVNSRSEMGIAGNIIVTSPKITLDGGKIQAVSTSGNGGNISIGGKLKGESGFSPGNKIDLSNLTPANLLLLRNGSKISTNAGGTVQAGGNGGNININSDLIVAIPTENSDISANAVKGRGGNVNIDSQGLFGIQFRPRPTDNSDITASSDFGRSGNVNISTPGTDPGKDKGELKAAPNDASNQISQACSASQRDNKFYITGRGGHPPNAEDPLTSDVVWRDPRGAQPQPVASNVTSQTTRKLAPPAVGWVFDGKGKVTLIAAQTEGAPTGTKVICPKDGK